VNVPNVVQGIRLAEVSTLPHEIISNAKQICQQISDQQKVFFYFHRVFVLQSECFVIKSNCSLLAMNIHGLDGTL